ncbi:MAG: RhuM family protein [Candidatus Kapabacteria bacterium]|nr:RhuM family protein [Candidatus Kapabacteria bacterium]
MENGAILIYETQDKTIRLDVHLENETVWLTQNQLCSLFQKSKSTISEHIKNIFEEGELDERVVVRKFRITTQHGAMTGKTQEVETNSYNLDVIISVGYRVKSQQGTQFRIWATQRLKEYIIKGFALNDERFKTGNSMNYFTELQERIREIRISEKFFYQKIKDIYKTSIDYNPQNEQTIEFFKTVQNKLLWAISCQTAAELVYRRVDSSLPLLGMQSYDKTNIKGIKKAEVSTAKNYLNENELKLLGLLVEQYLAFAETMAMQEKPMYMSDWIAQLDVILKMNGRELLNHAGKISHEMALTKSSNEFDIYMGTQKILENEYNLKELVQDINSLKEKVKRG